MTAIDELLTLLKEQGFEHYKHEVPAEEDCVAFYDGNRWHDCWESVDGEVNVTFSMTPQEAIAATLGRGTCKPREVRSRFSKTQEHVTYYCECGHELGGYMTAEFPFPHTYNEDKLPNYCPNCGARIEVDE